MKHLLVFSALLFWTAIIMAATWTGTTSINWDTASNWSPAVVPTSTTDVTIPNTTTKPQVIWAAATCRNLTIQAGSSLSITGAYHLTIAGTVGIYGSLNMSSTGDMYISSNLFWESGSTASVTNANATIYASGNVQFAAGSNVQLANGTLYFTGSTASTDLAVFSAATQIYALTVNKTSGTSFSIRTGSQNFTINGHITNEDGNTFYNYYTGNITLKGNLNDNSTTTSSGIRWDNGTLILDGTAPSIGLRSTSSYLNNVTFSQSGTSQLTWPLTLKGNLLIESGVFYPQAHTINIAGNWSNQVGPSAFTEGSAKVVFNGSGHQYCNYTETFNNLEVNKSGGALRVNSSTATVTCAQYDWTAGSIDVILGTFTISDLIDDGIFHL